jgi:hypothetical protein
MPIIETERPYRVRVETRKVGRLDITLYARGNKEARRKVAEIADALGILPSRIGAAMSTLTRIRKG